MAHAYYTAGSLTESVQRARSFIEETLGLPVSANPDVITLTYTNLSVEDTRRLIELASQAPAQGTQKALIIAAARLFHEAQNAMLKLFEEPFPGTTLILVIPSEGVLLPTLRSRLVALPQTGEGSTASVADAFLLLSAEEQKKQLDKIYNRSKSDNPSEKQEARREALELVQELTRKLHAGTDTELLKDLSFLTKTLHERSAPLKLIFEHLVLVLPKMKSSSRG